MAWFTRVTQSLFLHGLSCFLLAYVLALWLSVVTFYYLPLLSHLNFWGYRCFFSFTVLHLHSFIRLDPFRLQVFFQIVFCFLPLVVLTQALILPCCNYCKRLPIDDPVFTVLTLQSLLYSAATVLYLPCCSSERSSCCLRRLAVPSEFGLSQFLHLQHFFCFSTGLRVVPNTTLAFVSFPWSMLSPSSWILFCLSGFYSYLKIYFRLPVP